VLPEVAPLFAPPVFAFMADLFTRPTRLRADVVIDIEQSLDSVVSMLACHRSQVYEWLPYSEGILEAVPDNEGERKEWLRDWYIQHVTPRADHFRAEIIAAFGEARGEKIQFAEAFEISEYGASASLERLRELFPEGELAAG
jgi:hypothetical protein